MPKNNSSAAPRRGKNFEGYCRFEGSRADLEVQG